MRRALLAAALAAALPASAHAYHPSGERWPGRPAVIRYFNATRYANEVGLAAGAWNHSGARVRFVAASRRRAQLRIGYGSDLSIDSGFASVGRQRNSFVHLSPAGGGSLMVEVIAHELGHVLGLAHETRRCAAMNPTSWERCASPPPCSVLQADDVRGAIHRYGGKARRRAGVFCPPAPSWPNVIKLDGGADVHFTLPSNPFVTG
jgi:matrixin